MLTLTVENIMLVVCLAFNTSTGMPYGTVNLVSGIPASETTVTCTAGVGTFLVEFGALSQLTGDPVFVNVALKALEGLRQARSPLSLVGGCLSNIYGPNSTWLIMSRHDTT